MKKIKEKWFKKDWIDRTWENSYNDDWKINTPARLVFILFWFSPIFGLLFIILMIKLLSNIIN